MKDFASKWGGWIIVALLVVYLVSMEVINDQNIADIINASRDAAKALAQECFR
jgi:hypothetical protein